MARIKSSPVVAQVAPKSQEVLAAGDAMATPSGSFSSTGSCPTCPNCGSMFADMSTLEFRDHVADCSGKETSPSSPLSTPPVSPPTIQSDDRPVADTAEKISQKDPSKDAKSIAIQDPIRPYLNPERNFELYPPDDQDEIEGVSKEPLPGGGFRFKLEIPPPPPRKRRPVAAKNALKPKPGEKRIRKKKKKQKERTGPKLLMFYELAPPEVFEEYLKEPGDLTYEELYQRTAKVGRALSQWQWEWDQAEREIYDHETQEKAQKQIAEEDAKAEAEEKRLLDDAARDKISEQYKVELKLVGKEFQAWLARLEAEYPDEEDLFKHIHDLKNPQFMASVNKRKKMVKRKEENLMGVDMPPYKETKEEALYEKRKMGRLLDPTKFEDMKMADTYGFPYSSHVKHVGNQPLPDKPRPAQTQIQPTNGDGMPSTESGEVGGRSRRNRTNKRPYEAEPSLSPTTEEDGVPAKRVRKPKTFVDGVESTNHSRPNAHSRSGTPPPRLFASGKRVGRPPTKSKLHSVQSAAKSESPPPVSTSASYNYGDANGYTNGAPQPYIGPYTEARLHDAAESLVNSVADNIVAPAPAKKKHAGGRPRKYPLPNTVPPPPPPSGGTLIPDLAVNKPRNKGGRPKKARAPDSTEFSIELELGQQDDGNVMESTEHVEQSQRPTGTDGARPKRKRTTTDTDQDPIIVDAPGPSGSHPPVKKRKTRGVHQDDQDELQSADLNNQMSGTAHDADAESDSDVELSDEGIDTSTLNPEQFKEYELKRKQKQKSKKLSRSMKRRWQTGGMKIAQETRKKNNAAKKLAKEAAAQATADGTALPAIPAGSYVFDSITPAPAPAALSKPPKAASIVPSETKPKKEVKSRQRSKPAPVETAVPAPPRASGRARKPTRNMSSMDGADDDDEEEGPDGQLMRESIYDTFQTITTSPGHQLGKRLRKSRFNFKEYYGTDDDEDGDDMDMDDFEEDDRYD